MKNALARKIVTGMLVLSCFGSVAALCPTVTDVVSVASPTSVAARYQLRNRTRNFYQSSNSRRTTVQSRTRYSRTRTSMARPHRQSATWAFRRAG